MYSIDESRQALSGVDLVEMADLDRSQVTGHRVAVQYAEGHLGMDRRRAGELIAAGRKLPEVPLIHAAFCEAVIGWSKVIELIKVVAPESIELPGAAP